MNLLRRLMFWRRFRRRRLLAAGAGRSGRQDISERIEEILREEWTP